MLQLRELLVPSMRGMAMRVAYCIFALSYPAMLGCRALHRQHMSQPLVAARELSLRGANALSAGEYEQAEQYFAQSLQNSKVDDRAQAGMAETLWQRGERELAFDHMNQAVRLSGSNPEYLLRLGRMHLEAGDAAAASKHADLVLEQNRKDAAAWALKGYSLQQMVDFQHALECYNRALLLQSDYPEVQMAASQIYRLVGRPQRALATIDRMVDLHPTEQTDPRWLLIRGLALVDLGQLDQAAQTLELASKSLPIELRNEQLQLADAQMRLGEMVQSRLTLGRILQAYPSDPSAIALKSQLDQSFERFAELDLEKGSLFR